MHPKNVRNILWMLKRNGYETEVQTDHFPGGECRHTISAVDAGGQRWSVTGDTLDEVVAELLRQLGSPDTDETGEPPFPTD